MTDEQAVRDWLRGGHYVTSPIAMRDKTLALLDAKDAEYRRLAGNLDNICQAKASIEARAEQAEAALAERDAVITVAIPLLERSPDANVNWLADKFRFILPAKPADLFKKAVEEANEAFLAGTGDLHEHLREAIERAGGTISFEGEG